MVGTIAAVVSATAAGLRERRRSQNQPAQRQWARLFPLEAVGLNVAA
jgi:hypothetical protein